jgi:DNA-directed DNA polymerase III PolC
MLGVEIYMAREYDHPLLLWFLATTKESLQELYVFTSKAHKQMVRTKRGSIPTLSKADVENMSHEIKKFAGGCIDQDFLTNNRFILDINPSSQILNQRKEMIAISSGLPIIETSDNFFIDPDDVDTFEICTKTFRKPTCQSVLYSVCQRDVVDDHHTDLCKEFERFQMPKAQMIKVHSVDSDYQSNAKDLDILCIEGIKRRFGSILPPDEYSDRLKKELEIISQKDFDSYFIIVADMVQYAKKHMLVGPARGSAAGSLVCYLIGITEIDPIKAGLFFERFIDITRSDYPDIDLDFPDDKRHMILDYMRDKYGDSKVSQIGTISRFKARSTLEHIAKEMCLDFKDTAPLKSKIFTTLDSALKDTQEGADFLKKHPTFLKYSSMEEHARHASVHAAGILVSTDDIDRYCTVDKDGIAQVDKHVAEKLGLLKIDVLGLRTLSILEDTDKDIDWYNIPLDDSKTLELLNSHHLCGIFQLEGKAARRITKNVQIDSIFDISAICALARPGPIDSGITETFMQRKKCASGSSDHPILDSILGETYGLPIYQEQTLAIVREIGGFSWEDTHAFRKGISKSMGSVFIDTFFDSFLAGARDKGLSEHDANLIWDLIKQMGGYQMNKSHTYSYSVLTFWTAYFKAHHPLDFLAANLRHAKDDDSALALLREMDKEGISFSGFDVGKSQANWSVQNGELFAGFTSLNGIGEIKAKKLIEKRDAGTLTHKDLESIKKCSSKFFDISPLKTKYIDYYEGEAAKDLSQKVASISDLEGLPHRQERIFIAEVVSKRLRDRNEPDQLLKRNGQKELDKTTFLDIRLKDDSDTIIGRISHWDYERIGKEMDEVPIGAHLMIKAVFFKGIAFAFIKKWRRIDE